MTSPTGWPRTVPGFATRVMVHRGEITFFVDRDKLLELAKHLRDDEALRFEICVSVSGVHYPEQTGHELHAVFHLLSMTYNRRIRLEVEVSEDDPHLPSLVPVYPMANFHERETWDMFGIIFDGHPALTRILMPDDWVGHPQRKDYPLGGIPVEFKGAVVPRLTIAGATTDERAVLRRVAGRYRRRRYLCEYGDEKGDHAYLANGGDWDQVVEAQRERSDETIVINVGPQHPSTHGVMRLVMEMDGETIISLRPSIGFLHTGIEKSAEYRSWSQGSVFFTRCNYVAGIFNEAAYSLAVDKLLGITDKMPRRGNQLRVMAMEANRIASHITAVGATGLDLGATSVQEVALRERERTLDFLEAVTGLRMNNAYIRPGGVENDLPEDGLDLLDELIRQLRKNVPEIGQYTLTNPIFVRRNKGVAHMSLASAVMMGASGPVLRSAGYPWDLRKMEPPTAATRTTTSRCAPPIRSIPTGASSSASTRSSSRCASSNRCATSWPRARVSRTASRTPTCRGRAT